MDRDDSNPNNPFRRLLQIDVSKHVERKGGFDYLSWPFAVAQLRLADPAAAWEVRRFDGLPYLKTETGYFVEVAVTVEGITLSQVHPVLDGRNRPIAQPTSFEINSSIQRCLVKAIALHGLGLSLYAGEDLVGVADTDDERPKPPVQPVRLAPQQPNPSPTAGEFATAAQLRYVERLIDEAGVDLQALLDYFGFESLERVPRGQVNRVIRAIEGKRRAA